MWWQLVVVCLCCQQTHNSIWFQINPPLPQLSFQVFFHPNFVIVAYLGIFPLCNEYLFRICVNYLDHSNFILYDFSTLVWRSPIICQQHTQNIIHLLLEISLWQTTPELWHESEPKKKLSKLRVIALWHSSDPIPHVFCQSDWLMKASDSVHQGISRGQCSHIKQS